MKVKNEEELANILGMAFASYANKVQNGLTGPFKSFLTGEESVDMKVSLHADGSIHMTPLSLLAVQPEKLFGEQAQTEAELVNSTPVLEGQTPEPDDTGVYPAETVEEVKPKRKRKTQ
jgi:hypothetical protein